MPSLPRARVLAPAVAFAAAAAIAIPAATGAQGTPAAPAKTIVAVGSGFEPISPADQRDQAKRDAADEKAAQEAVDAARRRAAVLGKAAGLSVGEVLAVREVSPRGLEPEVFMPLPITLCGPRPPSRAGSRRSAVPATCGPFGAGAVTISVTFAAS
jgi:hypothetical protein